MPEAAAPGGNPRRLRMWERSGAAAAAQQGIFPAPRGRDPPPTPSQMVAAAGASRWEPPSKKAAGGQQLNAVSGGGSAPLRRGRQPRWLQRRHLPGPPRSPRCPSASPARHLGNGGGGLPARPEHLRPQQQERQDLGFGSSPGQGLGGRRGKSRRLEGKGFPRPARGTPGAA